MNELAYRANFWVQLLQSLLNLGVALAGLAVIFSHTEELGGWRPAELVALLGVFFLMSGLIGALIQPSMQRFMEDVRMGTLDFTLTKPEDAQVLVSIGETRIWKLLDAVAGNGIDRGRPGRNRDADGSGSRGGIRPDPGPPGPPSSTASGWCWQRLLSGSSKWRTSW